MKLDAHRQALDLLRQHPGWSDHRIAKKLGVAPSTVGRWRREGGYPKFTKKVTAWPRRGGHDV